MPFLSVAVPVAVRVCLVVLFPFSALDKILDWKGALKQASSSFLPGGAVLLVLGTIVEIVAPACIVLGWHDRLAAFLLAGFCAVTALLYHRFWACGDFWRAGESAGRSHFWDFLKNFGLVGGLLLLVLGTRLVPMGLVLRHPLSSVPIAAAAPPAGEAGWAP